VIDFESSTLSLVYLAEVKYRTVKGDAVAYWCGPPSRAGRGVVAKHPRTGKTVQWEPRLSGGRLQYDIGGIRSVEMKVSGASFRVSAGGADSDDLRDDARNGFWANGAATIWHYDLDAKKAQHAGDGAVDRNPTSRTDAGFNLSIRMFPFAWDLRWPCTRVPDAVPAEWDDTLASTLLWTSESSAPTDYNLNPDHRGKYRGHVFGSSNDGIWMEAIPYGVQVERTYALITGKLHCFCKAVAWVRDGVVYDLSDSATWGGQTIRTIHQTHEDRGPTGSAVKFTYANSLSAVRPLWWGSAFVGDTGKRDKIMVKVSGYEAAQDAVSFYKWDEDLGNFYNFGFNQHDAADPGPIAEDPGLIRDRLEHLIEDLLTDPDFGGLTAPFGVGALSAFAAASPSTTTGFVSRICAVPLDLVDQPPLFKDVLGELLLTLQADLCLRFDTTLSEMRLFPTWRGPRSGEVADRVFREHDLGRLEQPRSIKEIDDPWGDYATRVVVRSPEFYSEPVFGDDGVIDPKDRYGTLFIDGAEEAQGFAGVRERTVDFKYWLAGGPASSAGFDESARYTADHLTQRQRGMEAVMGARGFAVQLGELIQYKVDGYSDAVGQVRKISLDLDAVKATVRSLHINAFESLGTDGKGSGDEK
jgi:hypothetical protein